MTELIKTAPIDIREVQSMLRTFLNDLTDTMMIDTQDWIAELRSDFKTWRNGGPEPNWQSYRDWMNEICANDGMPSLFGKTNNELQ